MLSIEKYGNLKITGGCGMELCGSGGVQWWYLVKVVLNFRFLKDGELLE